MNFQFKLYFFPGRLILFFQTVLILMPCSVLIFLIANVLILNKMPMPPLSSGPNDINVFILNSTEHDISTAQTNKNAER